MEYDSGDNSLLLKDLTVIKTEGDYQTTITTDIRVNLPEMKAGTHSEYLNYALIADNKVRSMVAPVRQRLMVTFIPERFAEIFREPVRNQM